MFPDGVNFYPDVQDGERGYNTDAARGADTFHPFKHKLTYQYGVVNCGTDKNVTVSVSKIPLMVLADVGNYNSSFNGNAGEKVNGQFDGAWFRDFYGENKPLWMQANKYSAPIVSVGDSTVVLRNNMSNFTTVTYIFIFD